MKFRRYNKAQKLYFTNTTYKYQFRNKPLCIHMNFQWLLDISPKEKNIIYIYVEEKTQSSMNNCKYIQSKTLTMSKELRLVNFDFLICTHTNHIYYTGKNCLFLIEIPVYKYFQNELLNRICFQILLTTYSFRVNIKLKTR